LQYLSVLIMQSVRVELEYVVQSTTKHCDRLIVDMIIHVTQRDQFMLFHATEFIPLNYEIVRRGPLSLAIIIWLFFITI
jgi:hypothetical protein